MTIKLNQRDVEKIQFVASLLEKEYKYDYTHQQLAAKVGTNESKLRVVFKQVYKNTIHGYLTEIRIGKAKEILEETEWPLCVVASRTGFKAPERLIKNFKKSTGFTPVEWRVKKSNLPGAENISKQKEKTDLTIS